MSDDRSGFRVSGIQVAAGAAAAATAAFAASALGVAGTIVGAALVSATITVLAAVYDHSLRRARTRLREIRVVEDPGADRPTQVLAPASTAAGGAAETGEPDDEDTPTAVLPALRLEGDDGYHWRRIAVVSLLLFGLAMAAITAFELITGKPVSALFGGDDSSRTTIGSVVDRPRQPPPPEPVTPSPSPSLTTTVTETATATTRPTTSAPPATTTSPPPATTSPAPSTSPETSSPPAR